MTTEDRIEQMIYSKMCCGCLKEKYCHEECETCEEYEQALERALEYDKATKEL